MTGFWESVLEERIERQDAARETLNACTHQFCLVSEACPFDCIAITAPNHRASKAYLKELVDRVGGKGPKEVLILAVSDPEGVRIGSGGGTLNAILEIDEALKAAKAADQKDPQTSGMCASRVLLVHSGGDSQRSPTQCVCGKAWSALNSCGDGSGTCNTPMDLLLDHLTRLFASGLAPGSLVVTACDVMLLIPTDVAATADWSMVGGGAVAGLAIAADAGKYAPNHGVYCLEDGGLDHEGGKYGVASVREYLQKPSFVVAKTSGAFLASSRSADPEVAIDTGVVVFSGEATAALIRLAFSDTLRGCTTRGVNDGVEVLRLELYSDLLLALKTSSSDGGVGGFEAYLAACGPAMPPNHPLSLARKETWNSLKRFPLGTMLLRGATFVHLGTTPELMEMMTLRLPDYIKPFSLTARAGSFVGSACSVEKEPPAVVINSKLQGVGVVAGGAVVEHCLLEGDGWEIGAGSLISGVRSLASDHGLRLRSGVCLQQTDLGQDKGKGDGKGKAFVVSLFGVRDDIKAHYKKEKARICDVPWKAFLEFSGATVEDIWGGVKEADRKLWSARLFPVLSKSEEGEEGQAMGARMVTWMQHVQQYSANAPTPVVAESINESVKAWLAAERLSLKEILARADPAAEFEWRRRLEEDILGGGRYQLWDAVAIVVPTMRSLGESQLALRSSSAVTEGPNKAFCVPPPDPSPSSTITEGEKWDGPLVMNALFVLVERYSALKKARFGSETSAAALRGMRVLLRLVGETCIDQTAVDGRWGQRVQSGIAELAGDGNGNGGVWVQERDDSVFFLPEESIAPLLKLCQSDPGYQCVTYLGVDNAMPFPQVPLGVPEDSEGAAGSVACGGLAYFAAAARTASITPPQAVAPSTYGKRRFGHLADSSVNTNIDGITNIDGVECHLSDSNRHDILGLKELDKRAADEACCPAAAAQALARVACRLHEVVDGLGGGGHRSGPGEHPDWQAAMRGLDILRPLPGGRGWGPPASLRGAVEALRRLRESWLFGEDGSTLLEPDPHLLVRCARHYERAAAIVVSASVATCSQFIETPPAQWKPGTWVTPSSWIGATGGTSETQGVDALSTNVLEEATALTGDGETSGEVFGEVFGDASGEQQRRKQEPLPVGASVTSRAAARIDLAGGWTDTPPISYEAGGAVVNAAVTVAGERPVQARCDRIEERVVELVCKGRDGSVFSRTVCSRLEDFADFCVPHAPAALLKAVLICAGIVVLPLPTAPWEIPSEITSSPKDTPETLETVTLEEQLKRVFGGGGIRITSHSLLPQGSGMGTSSILAGVLLSAACVAAGRVMSSTSLIHAVLRVEQLMTAGGGHQDQVGGLLGGVKICRTAASLPLQVLTDAIPLEKSFEDALNERLVLVYTGKQRLARDLLQGVVRGWHERLPHTVNTVKGLVANADEAANACRGEGDLEILGRCLSTYWEQKKCMAPGAEPPAVKVLLDKLRPFCHGLSVCGAGGGGFVACITKRPGDQGMKDVMDAATESEKDLSEDSIPTNCDNSRVTVYRGRLDPVGLEVTIDLPYTSCIK